MRRTPRLLSCLMVMVWGLLPAGPTGCSGPSYAAVDGVVTIDGQPLHSAEVIFFPDPEKGTVGPRATAYTDEKGRFILSTRQSSQDGALIGIHRVCIRDLTALNKAPGPPAENRPKDESSLPPLPRRARVPLCYGDPSNTPFRDVEIKAGVQTLPFAVDSRLGN